MPKKKIDAIRVQFSISARKPVGGQLSKRVLREAALHWLETGESPEGMTVRAHVWRGEEELEFDSDNSRAAILRETMRRMLRQGRIDFATVR